MDGAPRRRGQRLACKPSSCRERALGSTAAGKRFAQTFPPHSRRTTASPRNAASRSLVLLKRWGASAYQLGAREMALRPWSVTGARVRRATRGSGLAGRR